MVQNYQKIKNRVDEINKIKKNAFLLSKSLLIKKEPKNAYGLKLK